jgi:hypothetical protein
MGYFRTGFSALIFAALLSTQQTAASEDTQQVRFAPGTSSARLTGNISGANTVSYRLGAAAGQTMRVTMSTSNASAYFNIYAPGTGPGDAALYIASINGLSYSGTLPEKGDYTIQVFLMRNAARRNEAADYSIDVSISATQSTPAPTDGYDAKGMIPCATSEGAPTSPCDFSVKRMGNGNATVRVALPGGGERYIYFENGMATSSDSNAGIVAEKQSDLFMIRIGTDERFEIPDAVIFGG